MIGIEFFEIKIQYSSCITFSLHFTCPLTLKTLQNTLQCQNLTLIRNAKDPLYKVLDENPLCSMDLNKDCCSEASIGCYVVTAEESNGVLSGLLFHVLEGKKNQPLVGFLYCILYCIAFFIFYCIQIFYCILVMCKKK